MRPLFVAALTLLPLGAYSRPRLPCAETCTCSWEWDPLKARDGAAAVLEGLALNRTDAGPPIRDSFGVEWFRVRVAVGSVWKGEVADTITVFTTEPAGACGFTFVKGKRYLLFLYRIPSGDLAATMCSLSRLRSRSDRIVQQFGPPLRKGAA